jgi:hypothetical protein
VQKNEAIGMSKRSYVEAVLAGFKAVETVEAIFLPIDGSIQHLVPPVQQNGPAKGPRMCQIFVRLLLSIDRRENLGGAMETVCVNLLDCSILLWFFLQSENFAKPTVQISFVRTWFSNDESSI